MLERLVALRAVVFVRGNTDRYVVTGERPPPTIADAIENPDLVPTVAEVAASFAWTAGCLVAAGWIAWLAALPTERRVALPDGTKVLGIHASPNADDGIGIDPRCSHFRG